MSGLQIMYINLRNIQAGKILGVLLHELFRNDFLWQLDNIVKWKQTFAKVHDVDFTFLFNAEKFQRWSDEMNNEGFDPNDDLGYHYMKGGILPTISSNDEYRTGDALMARLFYSL